MKKCVHCGAPLHDEASFCHACAQSQREPKIPVPPKPFKKAPAFIALAFILALGIAAAIAMLPQPPQSTEEPESSYSPRVFDNGGADMVYTHEGREFLLAVSFSPRDSLAEFAAGEFSSQPVIGVDENYMTYDHLFVISGDKSRFANEDFGKLVKEVRVSATPTDDWAALELSAPEADPENPNVFLRTGFYFNVSKGRNDICWEIEMLNGDRIYLHQVFSVSAAKTLSYSHTEYPMSTIDELQELINSISSGTGVDTEVNIYLPPVVYDGGLTIDHRSINLIGSSSASQGVERTTFAGTVTVNAYAPNASTFQSIAFEVPDGIGVLARESVMLENCVFRGCSVGAYAEYGGWICSLGCLFENNGVGIDINNPGNASLCNTEFIGHRFIGNGIAFRLSETAYAEPMVFHGCVFSGNGENIVNLDTNAIDLSGAVME